MADTVLTIIAAVFVLVLAAWIILEGFWMPDWYMRWVLGPYYIGEDRNG